MDKRKVIVFIIEGPTDETYIRALWEKFDNLNNTYKIEFITAHDLTSNLRYKPNTIKKTIIDLIDRRIIQARGYSWKGSANSIERIVHLTDTDGAYIPPENILKKEGAAIKGDISYTEDYISSGSIDKVIQRNNHKRKNLAVLINPHPEKNKKPYQLNEVPYHVFYMSCNIDHVFWGKEYMSIDGSEKWKKSGEFESMAQGATNTQEFLTETVFNPEYAYQVDLNLDDVENYEKSWEFIQQGTNSLKRFTNLNLFFRKYLN